jgi:isopentenyl-diphosphate delta-isomerase
MEEYVILVDDDDQTIGMEEKIKAHKKGLLHRAFSILIFNGHGALLLQKRNPHKYHCGNLWSNTCCSHPRPDEKLRHAAQRRLKEEMGLSCELHYLSRFRYFAEFDNGLIENEVDHIYYGFYNHNPVINAEEASDFKWIEPAPLLEDIGLNRNNFTPWLKPALNEFLCSSAAMRMPFRQ